MTINKLYFSHKDYDWSNHPSHFLTEKKINSVIEDSNNFDYHTSIEDINVKNIHKIINAAREIHIIDIDLYKIPNDKMYQFGRLYNHLMKCAGKVYPETFLNQDVLQLSRYTVTQADRANSSPIIWTAGCSFTAGTGVQESERWGKLLADRLNMNEKMLAYPGTSIAWSADQILRSDIQAGDIVVWGLTSIERFDYAVDWKLKSQVAGTYNEIPAELQYWNLDYFSSNTLILLYLRDILQVINYCNKIKAKLYIANMLDQTWFSILFRDYDNFIDLIGETIIDENLNFLDLGNDNLHPGPKQHKHYAERIFNLIERGK